MRYTKPMTHAWSIRQQLSGIMSQYVWAQGLVLQVQTGKGTLEESQFRLKQAGRGDVQVYIPKRRK